MYTKVDIYEITNKDRKTKTYTSRSITNYLEVRTCEPCSPFKYVLWALNTHVLLINTLHIIFTEIRQILNCKYSKNIY